ncbi:hypothetical protein EVAR_39596_1 [Eumeta japonica]|uniref:Uncharacterized protein n=1 Tax=Eumeta variegata TaxID=151549 RepID=A0A4C1Y3S5_EUMVA|nr:hypothetical protein EVAR_39596_1 [Eumeta japonica]
MYIGVFALTLVRARPAGVIFYNVIKPPQLVRRQLTSGMEGNRSYVIAVGGEAYHKQMGIHSAILVVTRRINRPIIFLRSCTTKRGYSMNTCENCRQQGHLTLSLLNAMRYSTSSSFVITIRYHQFKLQLVAVTDNPDTPRRAYMLEGSHKL